MLWYTFTERLLPCLAGWKHSRFDSNEEEVMDDHEITEKYFNMAARTNKKLELLRLWHEKA